MEKLKLIIKGVTSSDAKSIESKLKEKNGIETAKINYDSGKAVVFYDGDKIGRKDIKDLIEKLGDYKIENPSADGKEKREENNNISEVEALDSFYNNSLWLGVFTGISIISVILNIVLIVMLNK